MSSSDDGASGATEALAEGEFEVVLARAGRRFVIRPDVGILETLLDAGLDVPFSCQEGVCGQCLTRVIMGTPEHRDSFLSPAEQASNAVMMICVSRCRGTRLLLDV